MITNKMADVFSMQFLDELPEVKKHWKSLSSSLLVVRVFL